MSVTPGFMHRDPLIDVAAFNTQGGNVIIGTPGRLSDVMKRCDLLDCKSLEVGYRPKVFLSHAYSRSKRYCGEIIFSLEF
jgi:hypothetical protein